MSTNFRTDLAMERLEIEGNPHLSGIEQEEYEKTKAALRLMCELEKGRKAGEEQGWLSSDDVREHFRRKANG